MRLREVIKCGICSQVRRTCVPETLLVRVTLTQTRTHTHTHIHARVHTHTDTDADTQEHTLQTHTRTRRDTRRVPQTQTREREREQKKKDTERERERERDRERHLHACTRTHAHMHTHTRAKNIHTVSPIRPRTPPKKAHTLLHTHNAGKPHILTCNEMYTEGLEPVVADLVRQDNDKILNIGKFCPLPLCTSIGNIHIYIYIYIYCEVIIWSKFGPFRGDYLVQVGVIIWSKFVL